VDITSSALRVPPKPFQRNIYHKYNNLQLKFVQKRREEARDEKGEPR